jgi:hypothetical protein
LSENAGLDPAQDRYHAGYIAAVNDFLKLELIEESQNTNEEY